MVTKTRPTATATRSARFADVIVIRKGTIKRKSAPDTLSRRAPATSLAGTTIYIPDVKPGPLARKLLKALEA